MATTKGYHQYRGRGSKGKILLVILLVLILLGAITYLLGEKYIVYDADGSVRLELPFLQQKEQGTNPEDIPDQDVNIQYGDESDGTGEENKDGETDSNVDKDPDPTPVVPEKPPLQILQAQELSYSCLTSDPSATIAGKSAVVVNIKRVDGTLAYPSGTASAQGILQAGEVALTNLKTITDSSCYTVARISALCDISFAELHRDAAITYSDGSLWFDDYERNWLNPASEVAQQYLCDLAKECAALGFDEILLDQFRFPVEGNMNGTNAPADRIAALAQLAQKIREAVPSIAVSIMLPGGIGSDSSYAVSGLSAQAINENFDRVYVPEGSYAYFWVTESMPADFARDTRLVTTAYAPTGGSYMILYG